MVNDQNFCEYCGAPLSQGVQFCEACGQSVVKKALEGEPPPAPLPTPEPEQVVIPQQSLPPLPAPVEEPFKMPSFQPTPAAAPPAKNNIWKIALIAGLVIVACLCAACAIAGYYLYQNL